MKSAPRLPPPVPLTLPATVFGISALGNLYQEIPHERKRAIVAASLTAHAARNPHATPCFDGAGKYGAGLALSELGRCLRELEVDPDRVLISNKLGWRQTPLTTPEPTFEPGVWHGLDHDAVQDISATGMRTCHEEGLRLLGGYRVGLVSVHDPDEYLAAARSPSDREQRWRDIIAAYGELIRLRERGEVQAVGIGAKDAHVLAAICAEVDLNWVMLACSLTVLHHPPSVLSLVEQCRQRGIAVLNSAVFHGGFLTGGDHFDYRPIDPANLVDQQRLAWRARFCAVCVDAGVDPAAVCVQFGMRIPGVVATALNTSRPERAADNVAMTTTTIPAQVWQRLADEGLIHAPD